MQVSEKYCIYIRTGVFLVKRKTMITYRAQTAQAHFVGLCIGILIFGSIDTHSVLCGLAAEKQAVEQMQKMHLLSCIDQSDEKQRRLKWVSC